MRLTSVPREVAQQALSDDVAGLAAELAYRFFLALFPFAIFVAALGGFVARVLGIANPADQITTLLGDVMPPQAADVLSGEIRRIVEAADARLLSIGAVGALFFATGAMNALVKAMNRALELRETRPLPRRYVRSIALTLFAGSALIATLLVFAAGQVVGGTFAARVGLQDGLGSFLALARWPWAAVVLTLVVVALYRFGPNGAPPTIWIVPGAAAFALTWVVALGLYTYFVGHLASYGATYGALAGVAVLLIWLYLSSLILLLGVELSSVLARRHPVVASEPSPAPSEGADTAG